MHHRQLDPKISVSIVFVCAMFMSIMDTTIVNVALPSLVRQLHAPSTSVDAVVVTYLVSLAVIIPVSGWLGDRFGTKRVFLIALVLFSIASALCGLAINFPMLVVFRIAQGAAGGALTPVGTAILYRTFPPEQRVQVSRVLIIPTVIAPAVGPVLGGFLVDQLSWRWVFFVNVPIGIAACLFGFFFLYEHLEPGVGHFDIAGFLLAGSGLALGMYALSEGPTYGWTSLNIFASGSIGVLLLCAFVFIELRTPKPMIELRLLKNALFRTINLVSLFSGAAFLGLLFLVPLFLQEGRGVSALMSGLTTFPEALGVLVSTQLVARLYPKVGPRRLMAGGLTFVAIIMVSFCLMSFTTSLWLMRGLMFLTGAGMAYAFLPAQAAAFTTISPASTGQASALYNTQRQVGSALGVAVIGSVLGIVGMTQVSTHGIVQPNLLAYHAAFIASAVLAFIAACLALAISDRAAAPSMQKQAGRTQLENLAEQLPTVETVLEP